MNFPLRKQHILTALARQPSVAVADLAAQLGTTPITIRRDLALLAGQGLLVRTHGGAVRPAAAPPPVAFARKAATHLPQKEYICRLAARHVAAGDTIFIDCGSTTFPLCTHLKSLKIRVVTNSLPVLFELTGSAAQVVMVGGEVDAARQAVHGTLATEHLRRYAVDKAFLGADGLSLSRGLSAHGEPEASISQAAIAAARQVFLLCDSSKLERDKYLQFAPLAAITALVTDQQADPALLARYREAGVVVEN